MVGLNNIKDHGGTIRDDIGAAASAQAVIDNSIPARSTHSFSETLRGIVSIGCIDVRELRLLPSNISVKTIQASGIAPVGSDHLGNISCQSLPAEVMSDFGCCSLNLRRRVPCPQFGRVEAHSCRADMEEGRHHDAGVWPAVDPFLMRETGDAAGDQPIVGPPDKIHDSG